MKRNIADLASSRFDLVVIGAGITGAYIALDAVQRGMSVAVVDKGDFGSATSAASSKLLHGGIRYLQSGQFRKVRESALERVRFQFLAPHLTHFVPFIIPTLKRLRAGKFLLTSGMLMYEALCLAQNRLIRDPAKKVPGWRYVSKQEIEELIPDFNTQDLTGGIVFHESHMPSSERMTIGILDTAALHGAVVANYMKAVEILMEGSRVRGIRALDLLNGGDSIEIRGTIVINAAGPWIPHLNGSLHGRSASTIVTGLSRGAHIVTRSLTRNHAIAFVTRRANQGLINRGGRHVFIIPWRSHSLIGTSYCSYNGDPDDVRATEDDISDLIHDINTALGSEVLKRADVLYAYAGLYPLVESNIDSRIYQGTGEYRIIDHEQSDGISGYLSVFGAKYTTARLLAEKALDIISRKFNHPFKPCQTRHGRLATGDISDINGFRRDKKMQYSSLVSSEVIDQLISRYGTGVDQIMSIVKRSPEGGKSLVPGHAVLTAEIQHAVDHEMACHLDDFMFRRTGLGTLGDIGKSAIRNCADRMGTLLGWNQETKEKEIRRTCERFIVNRGVTH